MRIFLTIALSTALVPAVLADAPLMCEVEGREVVEHARKRGYRFEATPEDRCEWNPSRAIFIASAGASSALECEIRIFARKPLALAATPPAPLAPDQAETVAPVAGRWAIASILIAVSSSISSYPSFYPDRDPDDIVDGGWRFLAKAGAAEVVQYRIDKIEFTTEKDCTLWKDAF